MRFGSVFRSVFGKRPVKRAGQQPVVGRQIMKTKEPFRCDFKRLSRRKRRKKKKFGYSHRELINWFFILIKLILPIKKQKLIVLDTVVRPGLAGSRAIAYVITQAYC